MSDYFEVEQAWAWELTLSYGQERDFMAGLEAFDENEASLYPKHAEGILRVRRPLMLISLFSMAERFAAMGLPARQDPEAAVGRLIAEAARQEGPGVLHITKDWMGGAEKIDGMSDDDFLEAALIAQSAQGVRSAFAGGYADEDFGYTTMGVLREEPEHVREMRRAAYDAVGPGRELNSALDIAKYVMLDEPAAELEEVEERASREESKYINTLMFCARRLVEHYTMARPHMPHLEPKDVLGVVMARIVTEGWPGATWVRPPTRDQHALALELLGTR